MGSNVEKGRFMILIQIRWFNHLDPGVRKLAWTDTEEYLLIESHKVQGNKWAEISKIMPGRTDNNIKNHFYSVLRKLISRVSKNEMGPELSNSFFNLHQRLLLI